MRFTNATLEFGFASLLVLAIVILNLFGHNSDSTTNDLKQLLTYVLLVLIGRGTAVAGQDQTATRVADSVVKKINGELVDVIASQHTHGGH